MKRMAFAIVTLSLLLVISLCMGVPAVRKNRAASERVSGDILSDIRMLNDTADTVLEKNQNAEFTDEHFDNDDYVEQIDSTLKTMNAHLIIYHTLHPEDAMFKLDTIVRDYSQIIRCLRRGNAEQVKEAYARLKEMNEFARHYNAGKPEAGKARKTLLETGKVARKTIQWDGAYAVLERNIYSPTK